MRPLAPPLFFGQRSASSRFRGQDKAKCLLQTICIALFPFLGKCPVPACPPTPLPALRLVRRVRIAFRAHDRSKSSRNLGKPLPTPPKKTASDPIPSNHSPPRVLWPMEAQVSPRAGATTVPNSPGSSQSRQAERRSTRTNLALPQESCSHPPSLRPAPAHVTPSVRLVFEHRPTSAARLRGPLHPALWARLHTLNRIRSGSSPAIVAPGPRTWLPVVACAWANPPRGPLHNLCISSTPRSGTEGNEPR